MAFDEQLSERILGNQEMPWEIIADRISYSQEEGLIIAEGDVEISRGNQRLVTQKARYNEARGTVEVSGGFRLEVGPDVLSGEEGIFDLNRRTGKVIGGRLFLQENNFYLSGASIEKIGPNTYVIKDFRMTTCEGEVPDWSVTGEEIEVTIEGYGKVRSATLRVRNYPVFYLPYGIFPAKTKRQTGLLPPRGGYSSLNGIDVEVPFFWAITDWSDATFYERYMSERGFMQGIEYRYVAERGSKGTLLFDIMSDKIETKDLTDPEQIDVSPFPRTNDTRYWLRGKADQSTPTDIDVRGDLDLVSDQDYLREFTGGLFGFEVRPDLEEDYRRDRDDYRSPTRRSALRLDGNGDDYGLQFVSEYYLRPENPAQDDTPQPLGQIAFSLLPRRVPGLPIFLKFDADYEYVWRDYGQKGHSLFFAPELSYPIWFGRFLKVRPFVSYSRDTQWVDGNPQGVNHQSKDAYRLGADFSSVLERIFSLDRGKVKELKHKLVPSLSYDYRVPRSEDKPSAWFEPLDVEGKANLISLSIENLLDAREQDEQGKSTYRQWARLTLSQAYDINEERQDDPSREERPFQPLEAALTLTPYPDLDLKAEARWDHYEDKITFADLSMILRARLLGEGKDYFSLDYQYESDIARSVSFTMGLHLVHGFSIGTSLKRDLKQGTTIESRLWLDYQSQCWGVRLSMEKMDEIDTISISIRLVGLGI
ncbi:MAG: LPS-assembly protein LptD [Deltaproteobacteria bacterium]|nr:LPS-assembly protein LptD [Deltaproteobacteria bacterium]